jgi:hypothetical protein
MERKRALKLATWALMLVTLVIFMVSAYNLGVFLGGLLSTSSGLGLKMNQTANGEYVFSLGLSPTNGGFLDIDLSAKMSVHDASGGVIGSNSTHMSIPPGHSESSTVSVKIPSSLIPGGEIQNVRGSLQLELDVRTLWNLVGFKNTLGTGSGQP